MKYEEPIIEITFLSIQNVVTASLVVDENVSGEGSDYSDETSDFSGFF